MAHLPSSSLERAINYDYTHPERHYKGPFTLAPEDEVNEVYKQRGREGILGLYCHNPNEELCWSCGWSSYMEQTSSYGSRIKIMHVRDNIGLWSIGSQWILRDQPNDCTLGNDYITQQFLRAQPGLNLPLVKEMRSLSKPTDKIHYTLMSRAQGVTLLSIWKTLTPEQKSGYKDQVADFIRTIQQFTSPVAQKVDGSVLDDVFIGYCLRRHPPTCKKMGYTTEEWFEGIAEELRRGLAIIHETEDPTTIEAKLQELKDNFPKSEPCVLTHGDLNMANIIVKDDKIEAVIDWEMSGYYPWWAERWLSIMSSDDQYGLFDALWEDFDPELDTEAFQKQVFNPVGDVKVAWQAAREEIDHPGHHTELFRPPFCECKPYAGSFNMLSFGQVPEHKLREKKLPPPGLKGKFEKMKLQNDSTSGKDN